MHTDAPTRRSAGRLSREDQRRLGDILQRVYDDVVRQGVPDRFRTLLDELDQSGEQEQSHSAPSRAGNEVGETKARSDSDQLFEAEGTPDPRSKGSH